MASYTITHSHFRNAWTAATGIVYALDDVVTVSGMFMRCLKTHTAPTSYVATNYWTPLTAAPSAFKRTTVADIGYTALVTDQLIAYTSLTGTRTVSLPAAAGFATAATNQWFVIKDEAGTAGTNNIVIDPNAAELIDGAATKSITTNYGSLSIYTNGTAWFTF
jgi:hypothetical protein